MVACRVAQENGDFAEAFYLCSQCAAYMQSMPQLQVSLQLTETVQTLRHETMLRLHNALQAACTDFKPEPYGKVRVCLAMTRLLKHRYCTLLLLSKLFSA